MCDSSNIEQYVDFIVVATVYQDVRNIKLETYIDRARSSRILKMCLDRLASLSGPGRSHLLRGDILFLKLDLCSNCRKEIKNKVKAIPIKARFAMVFGLELE